MASGVTFWPPMTIDGYGWIFVVGLPVRTSGCGAAERTPRRSAIDAISQRSSCWDMLMNAVLMDALVASTTMTLPLPPIESASLPGVQPLLPTRTHVFG